MTFATVRQVAANQKTLICKKNVNTHDLWSVN